MELSSKDLTVTEFTNARVICWKPFQETYDPGLERELNDLDLVFQHILHMTLVDNSYKTAQMQEIIYVVVVYKLTSEFVYKLTVIVN